MSDHGSLSREGGQDSSEKYPDARQLVLAMKMVAPALRETREQGILSSSLEERLSPLLSALREVFDCELSFLATGQGEITQRHPDTVVAGAPDRLLSTWCETVRRKHILVLTEKQLEQMAFRSLMLGALETGGGLRIIGLANSARTSLPFYGGHRILLEGLLAIIEASLDEADRQNNLTRLTWAMARGEQAFLSGATEDLVIRLSLESARRNGSSARRAGIRKVEQDIVLADYLDAEFAICMDPCLRREDDEEETGVTKPSGQPGPSAQPEAEPLVTLAGDQVHFCLRDRDASRILPDARTYPLSNLACARHLLWQSYHGNRDRLPRSDQSTKSLDTEAGKLFVRSQKLANAVAAPAAPPAATPMLRLSALRTHWLFIHLLARTAEHEPNRKAISLLRRLYRSIVTATVQELGAYMIAASDPNAGLAVDSDWLCAWLAANTLCSKGVSQHYGLLDGQEELTSPTLVGRYLADLSYLVLYVLHCARNRSFRDRLPKAWQSRFEPFPFAEVPPGRRGGLSYAVLAVVETYARHEIGVPAELQLGNALRQQFEWELPLYASSEFYRDHFYHVVDTCLLGELLLRSWIGTKKLRLVDCLVGSGGTATTTVLLKNWYVAALSHDLAYVVEYTPKLVHPVSGLKGKGLDALTDELEKAIGVGTARLREAASQVAADVNATSPDHDHVKGADDLDHGLAGALCLCQRLEDIGLKSREYEHAIRAVLRHNMSDQHVEVPSEPISLLLMLCDHLQEWGRPRFKPADMATGLLGSLRFGHASDVSPVIRVSSLRVGNLAAQPRQDAKLDCNECAIKMLHADGDCVHTAIVCESGQLAFTLEHHEAVQAHFEPAISWLTWTRELQCFSGSAQHFPLGIKVRFQHRRSRLQEKLSVDLREMDLIQEFAEETLSYGSLRQWVDRARHKQRGIAYTCADNGGGTWAEAYEIDLAALKRPVESVTGGTSRLVKNFVRWKEYRLRQRLALSLAPEIFAD